MPFDLRFTKGQGTGNDFVLFSDPEGDTELTPTQIAAVCDRRFGVGADGVIRAVRSSNLDDGAGGPPARSAPVWAPAVWASGPMASSAPSGRAPSTTARRPSPPIRTPSGSWTTG